MKLSVPVAQKLIQFQQGEVLPASAVKHELIDELVSDGVIVRIGRIQKKLKLINPEALILFLQTKYGISDLAEFIEVYQREQVQRSELVAVSSNSKLKNVRTFKGFLVNSYMPVPARLNTKEITLNFHEGRFQFIYDFENFIPHESITIVGIENAENFRWIAQQKYLFPDINPLFVSRYPQSQNKDLIHWLSAIPNRYIHFGDFDFAGIGIYLNEFKRHLSERASFFVPQNLELMLAKHGNKSRYDQQKMNFEMEKITEEPIRQLIATIHQYKQGLDQEIFIDTDFNL